MLPRLARSGLRTAHAASINTVSLSRFFSAAAEQTYSTIAVETEGPVGVITITRPKQLNALNTQVMREVTAAAAALDADEGIRSIVVTGEGDKAFAAGADIKEMADLGYAQAHSKRLLEGWEALRHVRTPLIAAVNGYALGGGCEVAMACDIIVASEAATFGQPELLLGVTPGMGGTQRLTRAVGKYKAMDLVLTGRRVAAREAEAMGLVSRVVPAAELREEALSIARAVARLSAPAVAMAKECVQRAEDVALGEGLAMERRAFWSCFALDDKREGMAAFVAKREPDFKHS